MNMSSSSCYQCPYPQCRLIRAKRVFDHVVDEVQVAREEHQKHFALYTIDDELSNVLFSLIAMKGDWDSSEKVYMNEMRQDE